MKHLTLTLSIVIASVLALGMLSSCKEKKDPNARTDTYSSGKITFGADESFQPILEEEMDVFHAIYNQAKVTPKYMSESEGMNLLLKDKLLMMICARDFKKSETANLEKRLRWYKSIFMGYDGLAFIENKSNTDSTLSTVDVKNILTGKVTKWSQLFPKNGKGDIVIAFDNPKSSAVHYVEDSILGGKPITSPNVFATKKTADVIAYVEKTPGAIGIIGSNWLNDRGDSTNLTWKKNIRVMAISKAHPATPANSYKPYQAYLYYDNYPYVRRIYALMNDPRGVYGLPYGWAQFIISPKGQMILFKAGLLPAYGNVAIRDVSVGE